MSLSFTTGLLGVSRDSGSSYTKRAGLQSSVVSAASVAPSSQDLFVFALHESGVASGHSDARLAFYSIGSSLDLAALDTRVTQLITGIKFHSLTGLVATDYDPDTVAYIVAAYEAGGTL